jgi:formiminoglutamase
VRDALAACGHGRPGSKLLVADIAELNPRYDNDGRTARTAARLAYEFAGISR